MSTCYCTGLPKLLVVPFTIPLAKRMLRFYEKQRKVKSLAVARSQTQDTSGLSCQCSAIAPRQPANHQPSQSSIYTARWYWSSDGTYCDSTYWVAASCATEAFSTTCAIHIVDWWLSQLSWLNGRALAAQARGVLGSTPGDCWPFYFPLFWPHNI